MSRALRATARLTAWTAALVATFRLILRAGSASLSIPLTSRHDLDVWLSETPPADMTIALLRLAALGAVGYLLATTALTVVARSMRVRGLTAAVDRLSPAVVRRIVTGGSGVGLVLGGAVASLPLPDLTAPPGTDAVASAPAAPAAPDSPSLATMARLPGPTATMTAITDGVATTAPGTNGAEATMVRIDAPEPPSATMTRLDGASSSPTGGGEGPVGGDESPAGGDESPVVASPVAHQPGASTAPPVPAAPEIDPSTWVVEPGDSLWSIAEEVMTAPDGSTPDERTVGRYWHRLVEANRANLVDPDNADLLLPGQRLDVPPPS